MHHAKSARIRIRLVSGVASTPARASGDLCLQSAQCGGTLRGEVRAGKIGSHPAFPEGDCASLWERRREEER